MPTRFLLSRSLTFAILLSAGLSHAADIDMTPSHVVSLWTNINNSLMASAKVVSEDADSHKSMTQMWTNAYSSKKPSDLVNPGYRISWQVGDTTREIRFAGELQHGHDRWQGPPSIVFLNSGGVVNDTVDWLIDSTRPEQRVRQFYTQHPISGKSPSDALAMVDLANRRMDQILSRARRYPSK